MIEEPKTQRKNKTKAQSKQKQQKQAQKNQNQGPFIIQKQKPQIRSIYLYLYCTLQSVIADINHQTKEQIQKFIEKDPFFTDKQNKKVFLLDRLKLITQTQSVMKVSQYYDAIGVISQEFIGQKIKQIIQKMTQKEKKEYVKLIQRNKTLPIYKKKYLKYDLQLQKMVKVDVLSLFFRKNLQIKRKYEYIKLFDEDLYFRLFQFYPSTIQQYSSKFQEYQQFLEYDYEQIFSPMINFLCLIYLKNKFHNSIKRLPQKQRKNYAFRKLQPKQSLKKQEIKSPFDFKFSEIVYTKQNKQNVKDKEFKQNKDQIIKQKIEQIRNLDISQQKESLLNLLNQQKISILQSYRIYCSKHRCAPSQQRVSAQKVTQHEDKLKEENIVNLRE